MKSFGKVLVERRHDIMQRWYEKWQDTAHPHPDIAEKDLKDMMPHQLEMVGERIMNLRDAESPAQIWQNEKRLDPEMRVIQKIPIEQLVQSYAILIDTVNRWIRDMELKPSFDEFSYFYQAILELIAESVKRYAAYQAEEVRKARAEYLAGLSHQMRTPLAALGARLELLSSGKRKPTEDDFAKIKTDIKRLAGMVNGVMRLERFKPEEIPVDPQPLLPAKLIEQVMSDHEHEALAKGLRYQIEVNRTFEMCIDPDLFIDILGNLVQNAIKYTNEGFVRVTTEEQKDEVVFRVSDSGPGIPKQRQKELFKPVRPGKRGGVGIGLALAHRAVVAQGGKIGVESAPGKGATFWFSLPREVRPARSNETAA